MLYNKNKKKDKIFSLIKYHVFLHFFVIGRRNK